MSTVATQPVLSPTNNDRYGYTFDSVYNALKPQILEDYYKYYGKGIGILGISTLAGNVVNIAGPTKTAYEEGAFTKLVTLNGAIAPAGAGVAITFRLAATEYDALNHCYLNTNEIIVIPAEYMTEGGVQATIPHHYQVTGNDGGAGAARLYTAVPLLTTQVLAVAVPTATALMVRGGNYALESQSGSGKSSGWYSRHFDTSIKKWDWQWGGGTQSNQRWIEELKGGFKGIISKITMEADQQLDMQIDDEILLSPGVTNTGVLRMNNRQGVPIPVVATVGILRHMEQRACRQYYTAAYQMSDFDDLKDILNSQGITERNVLLLAGSSLNQQIENSGLDFIKEFSGGTDLMKKLGEIGIVINVVHKNGVYTTIKEVATFSDPTRYAAAAFNGYFPDLGLLFPETDVTYSNGDGGTVKLRNLTLGFKNYNGENRTRIIKDLPSVAGPGSIAIDTYDDSRGTALTEMMVIFGGVNKTVLIQNDNIL